MSEPYYVKDSSKSNVMYYGDCVPDVVIPEGVTAIIGPADSRYHFFEKSECIKTVSIPGSVTIIDKYIFGNCCNLEAINVNGDNPLFCSVDGVLFRKDMTCLIVCPPGRPGRYVVPEGVTILGKYCFGDCKKLAELELPDSLTEIGFQAFSCCNPRLKITYKGKTYAPDWEGLDALYLAVTGQKQFPDRDEEDYEEEDYEEAEKDALYGHYRFDEASGELVLSEKILVLQQTVFDPADYDYDNSEYPKRLFESKNGRSCTGIVLPDSLYLIDDDLFTDCDNLVNIRVGKDNSHFCSVDGVLFSKDMTMLVAVPQKKSGEYFVPDGVKVLAGWAFGYCKGLTLVTLPDSLSEIGKNTFKGCEKTLSVTYKGQLYGKGGDKPLSKLREDIKK